MMRRWAALMVPLLTVGIFATPALAKELVLEKYFAGKTQAQGRFTAINGVSRSFKVELTGKWNGKRLLLQEDFVYADGERDRKTWRLRKTSSNTYVGTRKDVVGEVDVKVFNDTARFTYDVYLDGKTRKNRVRFHDKMVLKDEGILINNTWVTKFGFPVARTKVQFSR